MKSRRRLRWDERALNRLWDMTEQGMTDEAIARRFRCSPNAIKIVRQRRLKRFRRTEPTWRTAREVAEIFGLGCSKTVTRWIDLGWLPARVGPSCGIYRKHWIEELALVDFMANPDAWVAWNPERIMDLDWQEVARQQRGNVVYLTPGQVADRLGVTSRAVNKWICEDRLPATRWGNWWVKESDLAGFVPPYDRSKVGISPRRFTPEEDAEMVRLRSDGKTLEAIASAQGRAIGSIAGRLKRLAVPA